MNAEALLRLADKLEGKGSYVRKGPVKREKFDLEQWHCGSTACAIGHAMTDPWFKRRGFYSGGFGMLGRAAPHFKTEDGTELDSWCAVREFFGLTELESERLFSIAEYQDAENNPAAVAVRIRKFVAERSK